jgi:hypothetical protein
MTAAGPAGIDAFRQGLDPATRTTVDALRALIVAAQDGLVEEIKWNAPSFRDGDAHRLTLGLERKGGVRVVLHRGAKPKDIEGFVFADPDRLATWPAADRGVVVIRDAEAVAAKAAALQALFARWVEATAEG